MGVKGRGSQRPTASHSRPQSSPTATHPDVRYVLRFRSEHSRMGIMIDGGWPWSKLSCPRIRTQERLGISHRTESSRFQRSMAMDPWKDG